MTSPSLMAERTGVTNSQGVFIARLLPPGNYTIEIIASGFQTARNVRQIGMDQHYQPRIVLQTVAGATVEIVASSMTAVDPTEVKTATNYDASRIDTLPTGRTIAAMVALTPGVTSGPNANQIRGGLGSSNLYLVDGQNLMDNTYNSLSFPVINDSIEETQVITGAISAEYGNVDGGVVNTLTKSGGNKFTGLVRFDLTNDQWNNRKPMDAPLANELSEVRIYTLGGYFIKDKLWFNFSYQESDTGTAGIIPTDALGAGQTYVEKLTRDYFTGKLSYLINQDHTIIAAYSNNKQVVGPYDYSSGHLDSLMTQTAEFWMYNLSWRAIWSPSFSTEVRFGAKHQMLAGGSDNRDMNNIRDSVVADYTSDYYYFSAYFGGSNDPDNRDNQTANFKGSWFASWNGSHEVDFGIDYYKGKSQARNMQSPTAYNFFVYNLDLENELATPFAYVWRDFSSAWAGQTSYGIYVNDKWKINDNFAVNIGVRWDNYKAFADDVDSNLMASASGISPRLGLTYDLFGDQKWIFKASWCRYNGAVMETITGAVSQSGSPKNEVFYARWALGSGGVPAPGPLALIYELENPANDYVFYSASDPLLTVSVDTNLKPPSADEIQLGATYSLVSEKWGRGFFSLTYVTKEWNNLIDWSLGTNGRVTGPVATGQWIRRWANEPLAERKYNGLEFVADWSIDNLRVNGHITWSTLEGNYQGESSGRPGAGQGLNDFRLVTGVDEPLYDNAEVNPYGYLVGHRPLVMRWTADYTVANKYGRTVFGFVYRFQHGAQYSYTRTIPVATLNPALAAPNTTFGTTWTQYMNNQRTHGKNESSAYHDLAVTHDFNLFKVSDTQISAFVKLTIFNFFNHRQLLSVDRRYHRNQLGMSALPEGKNTPWGEPTNPTFGDPLGPDNFGDARTVQISAGIRF